MNMLLIFFAIPLAVIILSGILESFINCPLKIAGIFFSVFIVIAFALGGSSELIVLAIIYTIIAFIIALIVKVFLNRRCNDNNNVIINDYGVNRINNENPFSFNNCEVNPLLEDTNSFNTINSNSITNSNNFGNYNSNNNCRRCKN